MKEENIRKYQFVRLAIGHFIMVTWKFGNE
jgi:hypothetical protein